MRCSLDYLGNVAAVDAKRLALVGYSLGAYLALVAAGDEPRCRAVVLASGGDFPEQTPFATLVRAAADPLRFVRRLAGRPLLMVNGRFDRTIKASQACGALRAVTTSAALRQSSSKASAAVATETSLPSASLAMQPAASQRNP